MSALPETFASGSAASRRLLRALSQSSNGSSSSANTVWPTQRSRLAAAYSARNWRSTPTPADGRRECAGRGSRFAPQRPERRRIDSPEPEIVVRDRDAYGLEPRIDACLDRARAPAHRELRRHRLRERPLGTLSTASTSLTRAISAAPHRRLDSRARSSLPTLASRLDLRGLVGVLVDQRCWSRRQFVELTLVEHASAVRAPRASWLAVSSRSLPRSSERELEHARRHAVEIARAARRTCVVLRMGRDVTGQRSSASACAGMSRAGTASAAAAAACAAAGGRRWQQTAASRRQPGQGAPTNEQRREQRTMSNACRACIRARIHPCYGDRRDSRILSTRSARAMRTRCAARRVWHNAALSSTRAGRHAGSRAFVSAVVPVGARERRLPADRVPDGARELDRAAAERGRDSRRRRMSPTRAARCR